MGDRAFDCPVAEAEPDRGGAATHRSELLDGLLIEFHNIGRQALDHLIGRRLQAMDTAIPTIGVRNLRRDLQRRQGGARVEPEERNDLVRLRACRRDVDRRGWVNSTKCFPLILAQGQAPVLGTIA